MPFFKIQRGDPPQLHMPRCKQLLVEAQTSLKGCPRAIRELQMASEDLDYYCRDRVIYYKSGEFFLRHTGMAILIVLNLA